MKVAPRGEWEGAQPRSHVLGVLKKHGVQVFPAEDSSDWFEMVDLEGDSIVVHLPNPVLRAQVVSLWRRFGPLHGFLITELVAPRIRN